MNTIMLKINRRLAPRNVLPRATRSENDFWEQQAILPENEKTIEQGGRDGVLGSCLSCRRYYLDSGLDLRLPRGAELAFALLGDLIEDPD